MISSTAFLLAFLVGTISLLSIFSLYSLKIELGRAILLMGAASIVGGSLIAVIFFNTTLTSSEYAILALISVLYEYRMFGSY